MPKYDYGCNCCGFLWEDVQQSINDPPKKKCPKCKHMTLSRVIFGGIEPFVRGEATTLGQLAERNSKKMGKYGVAEREEKKQNQVDQGLKAHKEEIKNIGKMSDAQKERFVENG